MKTGTIWLTARRHWPLLAALPAVSLWLYLALYPEKLWYDELFSVAVARLPWPRLLAATAGDVHPPLYYAVLHLWLRLTDALGLPVESAARLLSVVCAVIALRLAWRWLGALAETHAWPPTRRPLAWLLLAYMPGLAFYAAEARMYTLLLALLAEAWSALAQAAQQPTPGKQLAACLRAGAALGLATLTHNIGVVYAGVTLLAHLLTGNARRRWPEVLVAGGMTLILFTAWGSVVAAQIAATAQGYWTPPPTAPGLLYALLRAIVPAGPQLYPPEQLLLLLSGGLTTWGLVLARQPGPARALVLGTPLLAAALSLVVGVGLLVPRLYLPLLLPLAVLWAAALERARSVTVSVLALAVVAAGVPAYLTGGRHGQTWAELQAIQPQPGDVVYGIGALALPVQAYGPPAVAVAVLPAANQPPGTGLSAATLTALGIRQARLEDLDFRRAWVFYYDALPGLTENDYRYFQALRATYPGETAATYQTRLGDQTIVQGGLWLLQRYIP